MKISLLYSGEAGDGVAPGTLRRAFEAAGHELLYAAERDIDFERALDDSTELVVAAGGDGTVQRATRALLGRGIPLAILPCGTANNVAISLGIEGELSHLIAAWDRARRLSIDVGVAEGDWGQRVFLECVGGGLVSHGILAMVCGAHAELDAEAKLERARRTYRDVLAGLRPARWILTMDGARTTGDLLLLEVLNVGSVGPNLELSADADPSDGLFSVVTAGEEHRREIDDYLRHQSGEPARRLALPTTRARVVELQGADVVHVDGKVHSAPSVRTTSVRMHEAVLQILV